MDRSRLLNRPARVLADGTLTDPQLDHPEGVAVGPDGAVWCGGERGQIFRIDPTDGRIEHIASTGGFCLGVAFGPDGALYACDLCHRAVMRVETRTGKVEIFASMAGTQRLRTPNALAFDAQGRLYVSDSRERGDPGPGLFRFGSDCIGEQWCAEPLHFANGLALAPDGTALYVAETWARRIVRIAVGPDEAAAETETFAMLPGTLPDGLGFAADGALYVACYQPSQVLRIEPDSRAVGVVASDPDAHLLCHPTNLAFLGTDLIVANLGRWHLTTIDAGVQGVPLPPRPTPSPTG
jgi:sugar lactone lactonase YvrE